MMFNNVLQCLVSCSMIGITASETVQPPIAAGTGLEFLFQEQSYSSLHSGRSLACDHFCGDIDDPCGVIADFCGVIAGFCGVIAYPCGVGAIPEAIGAPSRSPIVARLAKHHKTLLNIVKHHETHVKHHETHKTL